jgi:hypothetical protein
MQTAARNLPLEGRSKFAAANFGRGCFLSEAEYPLPKSALPISTSPHGEGWVPYYWAFH